MATTLLSSRACLEAERVARVVGCGTSGQLLAGSTGVRETLRRLPVEVGEDE